MTNAHDDASHDQQASIADLIRSLIGDTQQLLRDELELAKAEMTEKARVALHQSLLVAGGAFLAIIGGVALCTALTLGLAHLLTPVAGREAALWLAPLIISVVLIALGTVLTLRGLARLRQERFALDRTARSLRNAGSIVKERFTT